MDEEEEEREEGRGGSEALLLSLRALTVECSGGDRAVRVRWPLSLIRPAHSRSSAQHTPLLQQGRATNWHIQYITPQLVLSIPAQGRKHRERFIVQFCSGTELQVVADRIPFCCFSRGRKKANSRWTLLWQ